MNGLQSAAEVPFLGNGVRERKEEDSNGRSNRLDLVVTDPINNCVVKTDDTIFSPLAASHISGSPPPFNTQNSERTEEGKKASHPHMW